uniref:Uncharacterized protein n=1 Tax=Phaseolus vulgaris TaxID=3885 RepID=V7BYE6_PHAVU|nr:hypothetical protein PHAVU_004G009000g [Phaseolus vulgaris]ESW22954.1 hypothetical protein PHAVU_004G009000g [Phaseolus vulgaris]
MEVLFTLLLAVQSSVSVVSGDVTSAEEWSEAVRFLGKAPESWLLDFLKVSHEEFVQSAGKSIQIQKKVCAKIKLVKTGSLSVTELGKMKSYILNSQSQGLWDILFEVVAAFNALKFGRNIMHVVPLFLCSSYTTLMYYSSNLGIDLRNM